MLFLISFNVVLSSSNIANPDIHKVTTQSTAEATTSRNVGNECYKLNSSISYKKNSHGNFQNDLRDELNLEDTNQWIIGYTEFDDICINLDNIEVDIIENIVLDKDDKNNINDKDDKNCLKAICKKYCHIDPDIMDKILEINKCTKNLNNTDSKVLNNTQQGNIKQTVLDDMEQIEVSDTEYYFTDDEVFDNAQQISSKQADSDDTKQAELNNRQQPSIEQGNSNNEQQINICIDNSFANDSVNNDINKSMIKINACNNRRNNVNIKRSVENIMQHLYNRFSRGTPFSTNEIEDMVIIHTMSNTNSKIKKKVISEIETRIRNENDGELIFKKEFVTKEYANITKNLNTKFLLKIIRECVKIRSDNSFTLSKIYKKMKGCGPLPK